MRKILLPFFSISLSASVAAAPFNPLDARSSAMGNTGVATASSGAASLYNPALLSTKDGLVSIIIPNIGVNAFADPDAIDGYTDIDDNDYIGEIGDAVEDINDLFYMVCLSRDNGY